MGPFPSPDGCPLSRRGGSRRTSTSSTSCTLCAATGTPDLVPRPRPGCLWGSRGSAAAARRPGWRAGAGRPSAASAVLCLIVRTVPVVVIGRGSLSAQSTQGTPVYCNIIISIPSSTTLVDHSKATASSLRQRWCRFPWCLACFCASHLVRRGRCVWARSRLRSSDAVLGERGRGTACSAQG
jgi:hypothetical protein